MTEQTDRRRRWRTLAGWAGALSVLATGGAFVLLPDEAAAQAPRKGGKLVVARPADITSWDPKFTNDTLTIQAQH